VALSTGGDMKIFTKPYYCYTIDQDGGGYEATVYIQDIQFASRNRIIFFAQSKTYEDEHDAIEWGEHQVRALSK
jgi:hypothetical protein